MKKRGFTLIELLVVISIVGVLSTLAVLGFNNARSQVRDGVRSNDIKTLRQGLEMYLDKGEGYPSSTGECFSSASGVGTLLISSVSLIKIPLDPIYTVAPDDFDSGTNYKYAKTTEKDFCYWYYSDAINSYNISYYLESNSSSGTKGVHVINQSGVVK